MKIFRLIHKLHQAYRAELRGRRLKDALWAQQ